MIGFRPIADHVELWLDCLSTTLQHVFDSVLHFQGEFLDSQVHCNIKILTMSVLLFVLSISNVWFWCIINLTHISQHFLRNQHVHCADSQKLITSGAFDHSSLNKAWSVCRETAALCWKRLTLDPLMQHDICDFEIL